jgi:site-specific recombinase XerD
MAKRLGGPDLAELALDWLAEKRIGVLATDPGHSDRARRADLRRWAAAIIRVSGNTLPEPATELLELRFVTVTQWGSLELLQRSLDLLGSELAASSRQRMISTLKGFTDWLVRRGFLDEDITNEIRVRGATHIEVEAFTAPQIMQLVAAATNPGANVRSAWPTRDATIVSLLAGCGLRVSELCALTFNSLDRSTTHPVLRVRHGTKGGKPRIVPVPSPTLNLIDSYVHQRLQHQIGPKLPIFIRHNNTALNQQFVDAMLRRLAQTSGVPMPTGAMAHALRHSYGMELAIRNVPLSVLQQLMGHSDPRTTSIYTTTNATELTKALQTANWL